MRLQPPMPGPAATDVRTFIPARGFALSRRFCAAVGDQTSVDCDCSMSWARTPRSSRCRSLVMYARKAIRPT